MPREVNPNLQFVKTQEYPWGLFTTVFRVRLERTRANSGAPSKKSHHLDRT